MYPAISGKKSGKHVVILQAEKRVREARCTNLDSLGAYPVMRRQSIEQKWGWVAPLRIETRRKIRSWTSLASGQRLPRFQYRKFSIDLPAKTSTAHP